MGTSYIYSLRLDNQSALEILQYLEYRGIPVQNMTGAIKAFIHYQLGQVKSEPTFANILYIPPTAFDIEKALAERVKMVGGRKQEETIQRQQVSGAMTGRFRSDQPAQAVAPRAEVLSLSNTDFTPETFKPNSGLNLELPAEDVNKVYPKQEGFSVDEIEADLLEDVFAIELQEEINLLDKLTSGFSIDTTGIAEAKEVQLPRISEQDPRLVKDKFWKSVSGEGDQKKKEALRILYYNLPQEHWSTEKARQMLTSLLNTL